MGSRTIRLGAFIVGSAIGFGVTAAVISSIHSLIKGAISA